MNTQILIPKHSQHPHPPSLPISFPQILYHLHWNPNNNHTSSRQISYQRHARQGTCAVRFVGIDDVLVAADEDAEDAVAEEDTCGEGTPDADVAVGCPTHPEETYWDCYGAAWYGVLVIC